MSFRRHHALMKRAQVQVSLRSYNIALESFKQARRVTIPAGAKLVYQDGRMVWAVPEGRSGA